MPSALDRLSFNAAQAARVSWFFGQKLLASRVTRPIPLPEPLRGRAMPDHWRILRDLWGLIEQDWRNVEAGYYRTPPEGSDSPLGALRRAVDFFADLSAVERRRHSTTEVCRLIEAADGGYPPYYLQKFHFQSDGYLSGPSARRYDHQVEVLFGGAAAVMRRQALVPTWGGAAARRRLWHRVLPARGQGEPSTPTGYRARSVAVLSCRRSTEAAALVTRSVRRGNGGGDAVWR